MDARDLNYSSTKALLKSTVKHPSDLSKNGDVGHAWVYLQGELNGKMLSIEGGHSGELGIFQPKYFEGVMNLIQYGYSNPTREQKLHPCYEPNPIRYMWMTLHDGYFQKGSGGHRPTSALKVCISKNQFLEILNYIESYNYKEYSLVNNQCCSFIKNIGKIVHIPFEDTVSVPIEQKIVLFGEKYSLWQDPSYSKIIISSPDRLQSCFRKYIKDKLGEDALQWYLKNKINSRILYWESLQKFPYRFYRYLNI